MTEEAGRPLELVGSAASGTRRGVGTDYLSAKGQEDAAISMF